MPWGASAGYYEEVRGSCDIPEGSRSLDGSLMGVGPGLCGILDVRFVAWVYQGVRSGCIKDLSGLALIDVS